MKKGYIKIVSNLYKTGKNSYRVQINRKNDLGELIIIDKNIEATSDDNAVAFLNNIYKENNISIVSKRNKKKEKRVDQYIYEYGKDYYRIRIPKNRLFPDGYSDYFNDELKVVKEIRDKIIAKRKLDKTPVLRLRNLTLDQFFWNEFIPKYCLGLSPKTVNGYIDDYKGYIAERFANDKLFELEQKTADLYEFINGLKTRKKKKISKTADLFEKNHNDNNNEFVITFDQLATIITGSIYSDIEKMNNLVKKCHKLSEINGSKIEILLYDMKKSLLNSNAYTEIEKYIKNSKNEWSMIENGKKIYGDSFLLEKVKQNDDQKYNDYYLEVDEKIENDMEFSLAI